MEKTRVSVPESSVEHWVDKEVIDAGVKIRSELTELTQDQREAGITVVGETLPHPKEPSGIVQLPIKRLPEQPKDSKEASSWKRILEIKEQLKKAA